METNYTTYSAAIDLPDSRDYTQEEVFGEVGGSVELPRKFMLDKAPQLFQGTVGSCHDELTEVLTENGFIPFSSYKEGTKVATVNLDTNELTFELPVNKTAYHYEGELIYGKHNQIDFAVTPNHNMVVKPFDNQKRKLSQQYKFVEAKDLVWYQGIPSKAFSINETDSVYIIPGIDNKKNKSQRNDIIVDKKVFLKLLAIFLSEGTLCGPKGDRIEYKIQLACKKQRKKDYIKSVLDELNIHCLLLKDRITFNNKQWFEHFVSLGYYKKKSFDKFVPTFLFQESKENLDAFIEAYSQCDGTDYGDRKIFYTSSKQLAEDLQTIGFLAGYKTSVHTGKIRTTYIKGRAITNYHIPYEVLLRHNEQLSIDRNKHTYKQYYSGMVYCFEVPTYHTLVTRRNHKILISGNCTVHGSTNAYNEKYAHSLPDGVKYEHPFDPWEAWKEAKKRGASDTHGWIFQSALQVLKDLNYIGAYININTAGFADVTRIKQALYLRKSGVATGLNSVNWNKTITNREYIKGTRFGEGAHIFDIVGWDDKKILPSGKIGAFYVANSWASDGHFWIAYADIIDLYSQYEFLLTSEQEKFIEAKKKRKNIYLQKSFENKIWNEERPADTATAYEIRVMLNRALAIKDNKISVDWVTFRSSYAYLFEEKIIRGKLKVYNETNKFHIATDDEIALMFTRAVMRNTRINELCLTRQQVVEVIARDFL